MKVLATIALLMSSSQALKLRDFDLDIPELVDENEVKIDKEIESLAKKYVQVSFGDQDMITTFET